MRIGFKNPKTNKQKRYNIWRERGFLPEEARAFARLRRIQGPYAYEEVKIMTSQRRDLLTHFRVQNKGMVPGTRAYDKAWRSAVVEWYRQHGYMTFNAKMKPVPSPWDWFDAVSYSLPEELRYTKDGRRLDKTLANKGARADSVMLRSFRKRSIEILREGIRHSGDPALIRRYRRQIRRLGGRP